MMRISPVSAFLNYENTLDNKNQREHNINAITGDSRIAIGTMDVHKPT